MPTSATDTPDLLQTFLAEQDVDCPGCGYNLRGLKAAACPECNERLALRVGLEEPRLRAWIAGLVGLAASAGFNLLLLVYIVIRLLSMGFPPGLPDRFVVHNLLGVAVGGGLLWVWLKSRPRLRRLSPAGRLCLAVGCWVLAAVNVGIFSWLIR